MFPSDQCSPSDPGAIAPPPAALVTIQPEKEVTVSNYNTTTTRVVSVSVQDGTSPPTPSQDTEPQDLTPIQPENVTSLNPQISHSSPDTPGKKERNSRKQCPYCNKGRITQPVTQTQSSLYRLPRDVTEETHQRRPLQEPKHVRHLSPVLQAVRESEQSVQSSQSGQ